MMFFSGLSSDTEFINGLVSSRLQTIDKFNTRWNVWENKCLTHLRWVLHICASQVSIGPDNGLLLIQCQAIIYTSAGLLSLRPFGKKLSEILIKTPNFSFTKMHVNILSSKWQPFCPGGDELTHWFLGDVVVMSQNTLDDRSALV